MYQHHRDAGFEVISVVAQDASGRAPTIDDAALWADELGLTNIVLADVDETFFPEWDPLGILPVAYLLDRDGVVTWVEPGTGGLEEMEAEVMRLLD